MQSSATMSRTSPRFRTAMPKHARASSTYYVTVCMALVAICTLAVFAQSGRRVRKSQAMPVPTPEATPSPTQAAKPKPAFTFIVGLDRNVDFSRLSLNEFGGVVRSCVGRLNESLSVRAESLSHDLNRAEAVSMAKGQKEAYIVLLQFHADVFPGQTQRNGNQTNVYIEYWVFAPITAKRATSGDIYPRGYGNRRINLPTSTSGGDHYLNQAARGAAERILNHFHIPIR